METSGIDMYGTGCVKSCSGYIEKRFVASKMAKPNRMKSIYVYKDETNSMDIDLE